MSDIGASTTMKLSPGADGHSDAALKSLRRSRSSYLTLLIVPALCLYGYFFADSLFVVTFTFALCWALMAVGFDVFSGYSGRINMGYAMFPGVAAYATAVINAKLGVSPLVSSGIGVMAAVLLAGIIGVATLKIQGKYFALITSIVPMAFFQITFIFSGVFGGEEGVYGIQPYFFDQKTDMIAMSAILVVCAAVALWYSHSKAGLLLRSVKGGDLTAKALGVDTFRTLMAAFLLSALIGGIAGAYLAHFQMFMGPEIFFIVTTLQIVTFAQVGGPGTIVGPMIGALLLTIGNEALREMADLRLLIYFVGLVLLLRFFPNGVIAPLFNWIRRTSLRSATKGTRAKGTRT